METEVQNMKIMKKYHTVIMTVLLYIAVKLTSKPDSGA